MNIGSLSSLADQIAFVDVVKEAWPWRILLRAGPPGASVSGATVIGPDGWIRTLAPGEHGRACAFMGAHGHYPAGDYTLLYKGKGALSAQGSGRIVSGSPGAQKVQVSPHEGDGGLCLDVTAVDSADPIRDIRLIMPGFERTYETQPFYPPFLEALKPFKVLRFIGWDRANRSQTVDWSERRPPDYASQAVTVEKPSLPVTDTGVAWEYQIALANQLGEDPWFTIPTKVSDDYVRQLAELVHKTLRPDLHPMVEFSNEMWNRGFSDTAYALQMGLSESLDPNPDPDHPKAHLYWYARRATQMFDIWNQAWGPDAKRIIHVIAGWQGYPQEDETILAYQDTWKKADVLALGAYAWPYKLSRRTEAEYAAIAAETPDQVLDHLQEYIDHDMVRQFDAQSQVAKRFGLPLVIYEGGPDLGDASAAISKELRAQITANLVGAWHSPRMREVYGKLIETTRARGVRLFMHFEDVEWPSAWGSFGALEYQDESPATSPVYQALMDARRASW
jgi:hypothetical protein